jgi:hypothetical protein
VLPALGTRDARLAYFEKQEAENARARRQQREMRDASYVPQQTLTHRRLDSLVHRFKVEQCMTSSDASSEHDPAATCLRLLTTVLRNAATKVDKKYRRLSAKNEKLWNGLLRHPEAVAILTSAGFIREECALSTTPTSAEETGQVELELGELKLEISRQLDRKLPMAADPDHVASLVARLEQLSKVSSHSQESTSSQICSSARKFDYVHPCSDITAKGDPAKAELGPLLAILQATLTWAARSEVTYR